MGGSKLSVFFLVPFLLAAVTEVAGGDLATFIVHVKPRENQAAPASAGDRDAWYRSFLPEDGRLVHAYHHVASGFAARLTPEELGALSAAAGFVSAVPEETYELHTTHTPLFLGLDARQSLIGNHSSERGAGVIIGMLDTGVLPTHPSFSDDGMPPPPSKWKGRCDFTGGHVCNNKLIGARSFMSNDLRVQPVDDAGHGTHTASTAAGAVVPGAQVLGQAAGVAAGMAPRAHVAMYKVCNETNCLSSDILAGVDAAVGDGCDIISMSIGGVSSRPFYRDAIAMATFSAIEKGIFVSMSAGNSGPNASSVTNVAPWMLTVAASTMDRSIRSTVRLGNGVVLDGESVYQPLVSTPTSHPLVYAGASGKPYAELCGNGSLQGLDVAGKIVLCEYGSGPGRNISMILKGAVVRSAGGAGMVLLNKFAQGYSTLASAHVLPASHVDYAAASTIKSYVSSTANPTAQILAGGTILGTSPAPSIAFFSSRGPSLQNPGILKPDVAGPGVNVLAAWPFEVGPPTASRLPGPTFNVVSGTSMSAPHLSGIAAFIKSKHPTWSPAAIKSAIMTTADVTDRAGHPILDEQREPADLFATGAGHVNPEKAADPGLVYDIAASDYVGYLCGLYSSENVSAIARRPVDCSAVAAIPESMLNYPSISVAWNRSTAPVTVERTVKSVGEVPSTYYAAVDVLDGDVTVGVVPRELEFSEENQERRFKVVVWARRNNGGGGKVVQGALRWVSGTYTVRSPISISFP
jgi:subtilisin family serine protease